MECESADTEDRPERGSFPLDHDGTLCSVNDSAWKYTQRELR